MKIIVFFGTVFSIILLKDINKTKLNEIRIIYEFINSLIYYLIRYMRINLEWKDLHKVKFNSFLILLLM